MNISFCIKYTLSVAWSEERITALKSFKTNRGIDFTSIALVDNSNIVLKFVSCTEHESRLRKQIIFS